MLYYARLVNARAIDKYSLATTTLTCAVTLQFSLALEAATVQLLDKSLLQVASASAAATSTSPVVEKRRLNAASRPQLLMVGPVGVEVASMRFAQKETATDTTSRRKPSGERSELGAVQEASVSPTPPTPGVQVRLHGVDQGNDLAGR